MSNVQRIIQQWKEEAKKPEPKKCVKGSMTLRRILKSNRK